MSDTNIFFSIIIPTYNRAEFIEKTVGSVLSQTYQSYEVIVVDDGSTDSTKEVLSSLINKGEIRYYYKDNAERGAARNYGVAKANGDYVYFLDSDDLLYPDHLDEAQRFIRVKDPAIFFQRYEFTTENGDKKPIISISENPVNELLVTHGNFMSCLVKYILMLVGSV